MDEFYSETKDRCKLVRTRPERIQFLLDYSSSLRVIRSQGLTFENTLN